MEFFKKKKCRYFVTVPGKFNNKNKNERKKSTNFNTKYLPVL